jgi:hypothetical protein
MVDKFGPRFVILIGSIFAAVFWETHNEEYFSLL